MEYTTTASEDNVVKVSAEALTGFAGIRLRWPTELKFADATYAVSRWFPSMSFWDVKIAETDNLHWEDYDVSFGESYEYKVERTSANGDGIGYIYAGVEFALSDADSTMESPGTVILVVDNTQAEALQTELIQLEDDLYAEGWDVIRHDVVRDTAYSPTLNYTPQTLVDGQRADLAAAIAIRDLIVEDYDNSVNTTTGEHGVKAVFLFGHVPIPMSGYDDPDGHGRRPFPADVFYGEMDGVWQRGANADGASSVGAAGDGEIIPRKYLTRASDSDIVQVTGRGTLLAIAI